MTLRKNNFRTDIFKRILLSLLIFIILFKGFGYKEVYNIVIILSIVLVTFLNRTIINHISTLLLVIIYYFNENYFQLYGLISFIFCINKETRQICYIFLLFWIFELIGVTKLNILITTTSVLLLIYIIKLKIESNILTISLLITCFTMQIYFDFFRQENHVENYPKSNELYKPGMVFRKITNLKLKDEKSKRIIRSAVHFTKISPNLAGTLIFEEGIKNKVINNIKWQQPVSWHHNQLFGNQYFLEAISKDGGLHSNIGCQLKDTGIIKLSFIHNFKLQPLIIQIKDLNYLHDSDYTCSRISNYQQNLLNELFSKNIRPYKIRIINLLFLLFIVIQLFNFNKLITILFILFIPLLTIEEDKKGDVRLVGKISNSHENDKFDAIMKSLIDQKYHYTAGNERCKILAIQANKTAIWNNEKLIIAEPNSKIKFNKTIITISDIPQGVQKGIIDSRFIIINDKLIYSPILKIKNTYVLATGSPGKINWKRWLKL